MHTAHRFQPGLTGVIDAISNAHNLAMVALTSRLQLSSTSPLVPFKRNIRRLDIDPRNLTMGWTIDFAAQALREILIGLGGKMDGFMMKTGFQITVSSEVMAILAVARDLEDLRRRMGKIVIAYSKKGDPVTAEDLEVAGAMTAIMQKAINPNLMQTIEGQPVFVHAGPFANIAIGQSSIIADRLALKLRHRKRIRNADRIRKFWNLKCRFSGLVPSAAVVVATIRALKMHGGGPKVVPGSPIPSAYTDENISLVEKGVENLIAHIETVRKSGIQPVVCINHFHTDTDEEVKVVRRAAEAAGRSYVSSTGRKAVKVQSSLQKQWLIL